MRIEERKVAVRDLQVGMYVCRLDRDWTGTPFPLQGVMVRSMADIEALAEYAEAVYVDIEMGLAPEETRASVRRSTRSYESHEIENMRRKVDWRDTSSFDDELPRARDAQQRAGEFATRILNDVREGRTISPEDVRSAVEPMVSSMLRNMDAFLWLENLRKRDDYDYSHAMNCSALSAAVGRHVGFPEEILTDLASGGLLLDVGKLRLSQDLFNRNGPLGREDAAEMRRHVELGLALIDESQAVPGHVHDMIRTHHERDNGSGYPNRLPGNQIPLLGRIAGVVDSYYAMTSDRSHRKAMSRHAALQELYRERDHLYAAEIVEQFMQCLSVYPVGSLVELSTGEVAIVMAQNPARRLRPRVMVLTAPDKTLQAQFRTLDLLAQPDDQAAVQIANTLAPGTYGLDPSELYL